MPFISIDLTAFSLAKSFPQKFLGLYNAAFALGGSFNGRYYHLFGTVPYSALAPHSVCKVNPTIAQRCLYWTSLPPVNNTKHKIFYK